MRDRSSPAQVKRLEIRFATDRAVVGQAKRLAARRARGNFLIAEAFTGFFMAGYLYAMKHAKIVRKK